MPPNELFLWPHFTGFRPSDLIKQSNRNNRAYQRPTTSAPKSNWDGSPMLAAINFIYLCVHRFVFRSVLCPANGNECIGPKIGHEYQWEWNMGELCVIGTRRFIRYSGSGLATRLQSWPKRSSLWVGGFPGRVRGYCFYHGQTRDLNPNQKTWPRALSTCAPDAYLILFYLGFLAAKGK